MGTIERYRRSRLHRCCLYCDYFHVKTVGIECHTLYLCKAKDKVLSSPSRIRPFCPCFKLDEQKCLMDEPLATLIISSDNSEKIDEVAAKLRDFIDKGETYKIMVGKEK